MTSTPGTDESTAHGEQVAAAEKATDLFAREALLALDRLERSFPADDPDKARKVGERFAEVWRRYGLDQVAFDPNASDAQRILVAAAKLATAPDSRGLNVQDASRQAATDASVAKARPVTENIARLRWQLRESFGDSVEFPPHGEWLDQSLSRLAKATVLRDVVSLGAKVQVSEPARLAAEQFAEEGQRLLAGQQSVSGAASNLRADKNFRVRQAAYFAVTVASNANVNNLDLPVWAQVAARTPVAVLVAVGVTNDWGRREGLRNTVTTGQGELRSVRTDLANTLDQANPPLGERDARAVQNARQPERGDRGR